MKSLLLMVLAGATTLLTSGMAHSSALVEFDDIGKIIHVSARIIYSGPALTNEIAKAATGEIQRMWNENPTSVAINYEKYKVDFNIQYLLADRIKILNTESCGYNFITVLDKSDPGDRSYYEGLGSRKGVFYTSDALGTSTTAAHEFGHGLMLDHNDDDQRNANVPGIMFARGTLVKSQFQWNPKAEAGAAGGTINPIFRKVRSVDIQAIPFGSLDRSIIWGIYDSKLGCIGDGVAQRM